MGDFSRRAGALLLACATLLLVPSSASARRPRSVTYRTHAHARPKPPLRRAPAPVAQHPESEAAPTTPRADVLALALRAYRCAQSRGEVSKPTLALIDYSLPSSEKRLWILDTESGRVLQQELVAHGRESGDLMAERFSNDYESYQSSVGFFVARDVYQGSHGLSLRLAGLEPGFNDHADGRAIVMHGAWYVSEEHISRWGRLGRSLGCPAVAPEVTASVIERLRGGAALFAYAPNQDWLDRSPYLRCDASALPTRVAGAERPVEAR